MKILLANPRGFCAGVERAITIVERALELFEHPVYVRHEVVHNRYVVEGLRARGARFVEELSEVPDGAVVIFSAHGVSQAVRHEAEARHLRVFDATCPLVTKVHMEVARHSRQGREVVLIGHRGHPEVEGTLGQYDPAEAGGAIYLVSTVAEAESLRVRDAQNLAYATQTTLSMDDAEQIVAVLRRRFPALAGPKRDDICYATQNRQDAVKRLAEENDLVLVVGSRNSSNSKRLRELAEKRGKPAYLVDGPEDLERVWFDGIERVAVTAGASAPEVLVRGVIEQLERWGGSAVVEGSGMREEKSFPIPRELL